MEFKTKYFKIILTLFVFFVFQNYSFAQDTIPTQIPDLEEQVDVTIEPQYPKPGDSVTLTLDAYGIDLNNSKITWSSGGNIVLEGIGQKVLKTTANTLGQATTIKALILAPDSKPIEKTITINPQNVDILWEAKTYTPPFYKGKAMYTPQESIKFVAVPDSISPSKAIYKWSEGGQVLGDKSGFGKSTLSYTGDILANQVDVSVEVTDGSTNTAKQNLSIAPLNPELYIYENNPLYGLMFNKELSVLFDLGSAQEGSISVYPYFYGVTNRSSDKIEYKWSINGQPIDVPLSQNDMTFRNTENINGKSRINVEATNNENFFEQVQKSTLINFQKTSSVFSF